MIYSDGTTKWEGVEHGGGKKNNFQKPIKILTSSNVAGNVGEQWKEVRDKRIKIGAKQVDVQGKTGKEIVLDDNEAVASQQVQEANKFATLEVEEVEK